MAERVREGEVSHAPHDPVCVHDGFRFGAVFLGEAHSQDAGKHAKSATIPFELMAGFLVVIEGQIGELDGLKFVLDTGATSSVIDRNVAARLRLKRRSGRIVNLDREVPIDWAEVAELQVGPMRVRGRGWESRRGLGGRHDACGSGYRSAGNPAL
jgi:Aspartyl protease